MMLATREDYEYPHIDWVCENGDCGSVYRSTGKPDTDHCIEGHHAQWRPCDDQLEAYVDILESLEVGDGVVICGEGPAPLMGPVEIAGDNKIVTRSFDSPPRIVRWDGAEPSVEWANANDEYGPFFEQVHHVETVEVLEA